MFKNRRVLIPAIVVIIFLIGIGSYFFLVKKSSSTPDDQADQGIPEEVIPTLAPSEIGLKMVPNSSNKAIKLILNNAQKVSKIEFELVYDADLADSFGQDEGASGKITRNVGDELAVDGKSPFETKYYDLGSCSSGKCRYDTGVTVVKAEIKVTMMDGHVYQVEDSLSLSL